MILTEHLWTKHLDTSEGVKHYWLDSLLVVTAKPFRTPSLTTESPQARLHLPLQTAQDPCSLTELDHKDLMSLLLQEQHSVLIKRLLNLPAAALTHTIQIHQTSKSIAPPGGYYSPRDRDVLLDRE